MNIFRVSSKFLSKEEKGFQRPNFITSRNILEKEKIEIFKTGSQLQDERKISLKKYYESTDPNSFF